jgi:hypothetical protein
MKLAMTMMVRDEADVITPMVEYHLGQGVDTLIVTDNGSIDGTAEILEGFAAEGRIELRHNPVQKKQQGVAVTAMAREAYSSFGADWVINADADEFWLPRDPNATLHDLFEQIPRELRAFQVEVIDMTGSAARSGTGFSRLVWQDRRGQESFLRTGLLSHSAKNAVHIGIPDVVVAQGNHEVNIEGGGVPSDELSMDVLHLPWRSWDQFRRKVENSGRAYLANPDLTPSPNHHGMREFARLQRGTLLGSYLLRHPSSSDLAGARSSGEFVEDPRLAALPAPVADVPFAPSEIVEAITAYALDRNAEFLQVDNERKKLLERVEELVDENGIISAQNDAFRRRRVVRWVDSTVQLPRRFR